MIVIGTPSAGAKALTNLNPGDCRTGCGEANQDDIEHLGAPAPAPDGLIGPVALLPVKGTAAMRAARALSVALGGRRARAHPGSCEIPPSGMKVPRATLPSRFTAARRIGPVQRFWECCRMISVLADGALVCGREWLAGQPRTRRGT